MKCSSLVSLAVFNYTERGAWRNLTPSVIFFVSFLVCSQEEQFYINGKLPDFHQVDVPDVWIGLSGTLHAVYFDSHIYINGDV